MLRIGQLSELSGVPASAIRYYERLDILKGIQRTAGGDRRYTEDSVHRLQIIKGMQSLGFSLAEIPALLSEDLKGCDHQHVMQAVDTRLSELGNLIDELSVKHKALADIKHLLKDTWAAGKCLGDQELRALIGDLSI